MNQNPPSTEPVFDRLSLAQLPKALRRGWTMFLSTRPLSVTYAMPFALIGVLILVMITRASHAPLIFPIAGAFMLIGPLLLSGFFALADRIAKGEDCRFSDIVAGLSRSSRPIQLIALVCSLLFVVWVVNAAYLYGVLVGRAPEPTWSLLAPSGNVIAFLLWSSLLGLFLAFAVFAISAFSVPLLYYRRAGFVQAVKLSVRAVLANFVPSIVWGLILSIGIIGSILVFPLFLITFPVLAYASHALYRELFPE